jgi:hypothetical protein
MMTTRQKIVGAVGGSTLLVVLGTALVIWLGPDRQIRRALALEQQLANGEELSQVERNALKTQLMRTVDEMDRDRLRQLQGRMRERDRQLTQQSMEAFQAASETEKAAILDEAIDRMVKSRETASAMRSGRGWGGRRGGRTRRPDQARPDGQAGRQRPDNAGQQARPRPDGGRDANARDRGRRQGGNDGRPELSEEERALRTAYYEALAKRAEERGVELSRWRRGRRG